MFKMFKNISNNQLRLSVVISSIICGATIGTLISYDKYKPYPPL